MQAYTTCARPTWNLKTVILVPEPVCTGLFQARSTCSIKEYENIKRQRAADWGWVGVWICDGVPSSLWEQPGWAWQAWMPDATSHLALDETPEGDTGWCQPSENTSSVFENKNGVFMYTAALCESSKCAPADLWHIHKYYMFYICSLHAGRVLKGTERSWRKSWLISVTNKHNDFLNESCGVTPVFIHGPCTA